MSVSLVCNPSQRRHITVPSIRHACSDLYLSRFGGHFIMEASSSPETESQQDRAAINPCRYVLTTRSCHLPGEPFHHINWKRTILWYSSEQPTSQFLHLIWGFFFKTPEEFDHFPPHKSLNLFLQKPFRNLFSPFSCSDCCFDLATLPLYDIRAL